MDLSFSPDDDAFRQQVPAFIRDHYSPSCASRNPYTDLTERQGPPQHGILQYAAKAGYLLSRGKSI
jgi:hypothetical protein